MPSLETGLFIVLLAAAVGPLLLLCVCAIAVYFDVPIATRLLDATAQTMIFQWRLGAWINLIGGIMIAGLGIWLACKDGPLVQRIGSFLILMALGLWRIIRGGSILWGRDRAP